MQHTTNYNLPYPEGADTYNPLLISPVAYPLIDSAMKDNKDHTIRVATAVKGSNNFAITRAVATSNMFYFIADDDFVTGNTFTVDGEVVTARTVSGEALKTNAFRINSCVLCILNNNIMTCITANSFNVDDALSTTSENAVQNKVITVKINEVSGDLELVKTDVATLKTDMSGVKSTVQTVTGQVAAMDARVTSAEGEITQLNNDLTASDNNVFRFRVNGEGEYGYLKSDDTFTPFKSSPKLLWQRAVSDFPAQTLNIDFSQYDYVVVRLQYTTTNTNQADCLCKKGQANSACVNISNSGNPVYYVLTRTITVTENSIAFTTGYGWAGNSANGYAIPIAIYGIKLGEFN